MMYLFPRQQSFAALAMYCTVAVQFITINALPAAEAFDPPTVEMPSELHDAAFDLLVDLKLAGEAIDERDAVKLTDAAILLGHAEHLLGRKHSSGLTSAQFAQLAQELATGAGDAKSLGRLRMLALRSKNKKLADEIGQVLVAVSRLGGGVRALDDQLVVDIEQMPADSYFVYRVALEQIHLAGETGDMQAIERVKVWVTENAHWLSEKQRAELNTQIQAAVKKADRGGPAQMFQRLVSASRDSKAVDIFKARTQHVDAHARLITATAGAAKIRSDIIEQRVKILNDIELLKQQSLVTKQKKAELYYALKQQYEKNRKPRKVDGNTAARLAHVSAPRRMRLTELKWPAIFRRYPFATAKQQYTKILATRTTQNSGAGSESHVAIVSLSDRVISVMAQRINSMSPTEYVLAKKFVRALVHSSTFPVDGTQVVSAPASSVAKLDLPTTPATAGPDGAPRGSKVALNGMSPAAYLLFRALLEDIDIAVAAGDSAAIVALKEVVAGAPLLTTSQRSFLQSKAEKIEGKAGASGPGAFDNTLAALSPVAGMEPAPWAELRGSKEIAPDAQKQAYRLLVNLYAIAR